MIVVDGSAVVEALLGGGRGARAVAAMRGAVVLAPDILDAEVLQALKGLERGGLLSNARAETALQRLITGPFRRIPSRSLAPDAWRLRHNLSLYDAMYVALAARQEAALLTADRGMATTAMDAGVTVTRV